MLTAVAGMDAPHPRVDERLCRTLLLLLLGCRRGVVDVAGGARSRGGGRALVRLGDRRRAAAGRRRQRRRERRRGRLLLEVAGRGAGPGRGRDGRRPMVMVVVVGDESVAVRHAVVVALQPVVQRRRGRRDRARLELQPARRRRVPHRRRRVAEPSAAAATTSVLERRAELVEARDRLHGATGGRVDRRVVVGVRGAIHEVVSGGGGGGGGDGSGGRRDGSEVFASVGRRRLTHAGVDEVGTHRGDDGGGGAVSPASRHWAAARPLIGCGGSGCPSIVSAPMT